MRPLRLLTALLLLVAGSARAQHPACVEVALPEALPDPESWRNLLLQETRPLLGGEAGECAKVELAAEQGDSLPMLQVSWAGAVRTMPLALEELPPSERARASALLARGMLQQIVEQHEREAPDETAAEPAAQPPAEEEAENAKNAAPIPRAPSNSATQLTPPQLPSPEKRRRKSRWDDYNWAWQPDEAARIAAARDDRFMGTDRMRRGSLWSGFASSGTTIGLVDSNTMLLLELGALRVINARWLRFGVALLGMFSPLRPATGGPGLRGSLEFRVANERRARMWLGPGLSIVELVVNGEAGDGVSRGDQGGTFIPPYRVARPIAHVDGRATVDIAINGRAYIYLAAEFAFVLRYLEVVNNGSMLFAYVGPRLGFHLGAGF